MKEFMHHSTFTGMAAGGFFTGDPVTLFTDGVPHVEKAPPFELKEVDPAVIRKIEQHYAAAHSRVDSLYSRGECVNILLMC